MTAAQLAKAVDPVIVTIEVPGGAQGSGFILDAKGTIVTNYHVIEGAKAATVTFHDKTTAEVKGFVAILPGKDLAILRIEVPNKKTVALPLAESPPSKGDKAFAFGAPRGLAGTISDGIVSAAATGSSRRQAGFHMRVPRGIMVATGRMVAE
jgi:S1-C subfamily serine protease